MKKIQAILIFASLAMVFVSCKKEEIKTYDGETNIYFPWAVDQPYRDAPLFDSLNVAFAYSPGVTDLSVSIPVRINGVVSDKDRSYKVIAASASTAQAGIHFEALPTSFTMPAGNTVDSIRVKLLRTPDMLDSTFTIVLALQPNENFKTNMVDKVINPTTGQKLHYSQFTIKVDDILIKPKGWFNYFMGTFTRKKLLLMVELLDVDIPTLNIQGGYGFPALQYFGAYTQRYLNDKKAAGQTIYEEDGTEMIMGPGVQ